MITSQERNSFNSDGWILTQICDYKDIAPFDCGDEDLNEYFHRDAAIYKRDLLTKTYIFKDEAPETPFPVALVDLCNDVIRKEKFKLHDGDFFSKPDIHYPAVSRLGVHKHFQRKNVSSFLINMIKRLFLTDNRTGCRFLTVDAYNNPGTIISVFLCFSLISKDY